MDINTIKKNGKVGLANALVEIEKNPFDKKSLSLLTQAHKSKNGTLEKSLLLHSNVFQVHSM